MTTTYKIMGKYRNHPKEEIDTADSLREAKYLLGEYQIAYGNDWNLSIKKEREKKSSNFCPKCGSHYFTHNSDGSCVEEN